MPVLQIDGKPIAIIDSGAAAALLAAASVQIGTAQGPAIFQAQVHTMPSRPKPPMKTMTLVIEFPLGENSWAIETSS